MSRTLLLAVVLWPAAHLVADAQHATIPVVVEGVEAAIWQGGALRVVVDDDDDDENGIPDRLQPGAVPREDLVWVEVPARGVTAARAQGGVRLVVRGAVVQVARAAGGDLRFGVQGIQASSEPGDAAVQITVPGGSVRIPLTVVSLGFVPDARPGPGRGASVHALGVSHRITNDASLPRGGASGTRERDPQNFRVEVRDPSGPDIASIELVAGPTGGPVRSRRSLRARRAESGALLAPWTRLVADEMDEQAPGVGGQVLRVALRDVVRARYSSPGGVLEQSIRVAEPGANGTSQAALRGRLRVRVVTSGGRPAVGTTTSGALRIGREQVRISNEIWLQCFAGFGDPSAADVRVVDPPPPSLLAIADGDGLPARGGGSVRLRVDGRALAPVTTQPGAAPVDTALQVAEAMRARGFMPTVTVNPRTEFGAGQSADILVRRTNGDLATISRDANSRLSTDARQSVQIGVVDLSDGLTEFDNMTAAAGTLEERALLRAIADSDPTTIDLVIVNRFSSGERQGEAFIESDGGALVNMVLLDRTGIANQRRAWTQAHELGHVLLDQPYHPDNFGADRPWLLMDANSVLGTVLGPKRLTPSECARARHRSGPHSVPTLLGPAP